MIAVIFEVRPKVEHKQDYLEKAQELKSLLESTPGFVSIERFESLSESGKLLSLSFFESEEAVTTWRNTLDHRKAQALGRASYFDDYRLRIADVLRDYGMDQRSQAPEDSRDVHDKAV